MGASCSRAKIQYDERALKIIVEESQVDEILEIFDKPQRYDLLPEKVLGLIYAFNPQLIEELNNKLPEQLDYNEVLKHSVAYLFHYLINYRQELPSLSGIEKLLEKSPKIENFPLFYLCVRNRNIYDQENYELQEKHLSHDIEFKSREPKLEVRPINFDTQKPLLELLIKHGAIDINKACGSSFTPFSLLSVLFMYLTKVSANEIEFFINSGMKLNFQNDFVVDTLERLMNNMSKLSQEYIEEHFPKKLNVILESIGDRQFEQSVAYLSTKSQFRTPYKDYYCFNYFLEKVFSIRMPDICELPEVNEFNRCISQTKELNSFLFVKLMRNLIGEDHIVSWLKNPENESEYMHRLNIFDYIRELLSSNYKFTNSHKESFRISDMLTKGIFLQKILIEESNESKSSYKYHDIFRNQSPEILSAKQVVNNAYKVLIAEASVNRTDLKQKKLILDLLQKEFIDLALEQEEQVQERPGLLIAEEDMGDSSCYGVEGNYPEGPGGASCSGSHPDYFEDNEGY